MASEMPVFPDVGSRMILSGVSEPSASACSTILLAMRSLSEPVGFEPSSFAHSLTLGFGDRRGMPTSGVLPMASRMSFARMRGDYPRTVTTDPGTYCSAPGDGGEDRHGVAVLDVRLQRPEVADVLVVHVDVDEPVQAAVGRQNVPCDPGVARLQVVEDLAERRPFPLHGGLAARELSQDRRQLHSDSHQWEAFPIGGLPFGFADSTLITRGLTLEPPEPPTRPRRARLPA